ncbi:uncharacterized protein LOC127750807 [Frankliniella occidentalis]|uniref:Uncharacterized protein LOC127750807 n=1 Tax=Frankliniella occidentalis TaxID=133901 RepID=A0A9C6X4Y8_FRAOC|nr:uncharacterized protein LOC127750807 [Frankliniella occidentalis]
MVFLCVCGGRFQTPDSLATHMQLRHPVDSVINNYKCLQHTGCKGLFFDSIQKFKIHLLRKHAADIGVDNLMEPVDNAEHEFLEINVPGNAAELPPQDEVIDVPNFETFANAVHQSGMIFVSKLYNKDTVPRCVVQEVVAFAQEYMGGFTSLLKTKVLHALANNDDVETNEIKAMFSVLENPFAEIATEAQQITAFKNAGAYIGPSNYFIGSSLKDVCVRGTMIPQMVPSYGQFIDMKLTLKYFLELPGVFDKIMLNYANLSDEHDIISNFIQGSLWRDISAPYVAEEKIVLPLFAYSDDYEPNDGLGSHCLDEKTSALYYKIPCIPPEYLSLLRYIFIAAVFYADDRKEYGTPACVKCFLEQLKYLEKHGVIIELPEKSVTVYFVLGLLLGDNLGLNVIMGFVESFSANYCCRVCKVYQKDLKFMIREDPALLRTPDNYETDLGINDSERTGIKEECPFNVLNSFHNCVNVAGDVLHDVEIGICGYALPRILFWLIHVRQYFTHETLVARVRGFNYGPSECGNKPSVSKLSPNRIASCTKFLLSGSETLCLIQNLGLMVGDLVPSDDDVWLYYSRLLNMLDFILAPSFVVGSEVLFKTLVTEHHEAYIDTFDESLKPVHHLVLHYYRYMLLVGPPIHTSTKRFESKNRESKQVARSTNCRVNLLFTLMIKNQLKFTYQLLCKTALMERFQSGNGKMFRVGELPFGHVVGLHENENVTSVEWIDLNGTQYQIDHIVVYKLTYLFPIFGKIVSILLFGNNQVVFVLKVLETLYFSDHYHTFVVRETDDVHCCSPAALISHQALWLRISVTGDSFVSVRHLIQ